MALPGSKLKARTHEDRLLRKYWKDRGGLMIAEVPIGGSGGPGRWPAGTERRRIDAVRLSASPNQSGVVRFAPGRNGAILSSLARQVELIEVKAKLNRLVIGQVLAAQDMYERQYGKPASRLTIVCERTDPGLEWVCQRRGIRVWSSAK